MPDLPLVSIVTPSYNMAPYLRETVESVLSQDYPNIEYIVMDGGSTDDSLKILESYKNRLRYTSAPDGGAADAVNRGFELCNGSVFAWLNADDTYLPGAISAAVECLQANAKSAVVYGQGYWVDSDGEGLRPYPTGSRSVEMLNYDCYICQPACFLRTKVFRESGGLNSGMYCAFDYDLWVRISRTHELTYLEKYLATTRMHRGSKTLGNRHKIFQEGMGVLKKHFGYIPFHWVYSYLCWRIDKRDQFYDSLNPSLLSYSLSLPVGLYNNPRHMPTYCAEWWRVMSLDGLRRMVERARGGTPVAVNNRAAKTDSPLPSPRPERAAAGQQQK